MEPVAMCGNCCERCKAFAPNIAKKDERAELAAMWAKYYGLDYAPEDIYCDGCRGTRPGARLVDPCCPVRVCVLEKGLAHCGDCGAWPCDTFAQREGLCLKDALRQQGDAFDAGEYEACLSAYDNRTRIDAYRRAKGEGAG